MTPSPSQLHSRIALDINLRAIARNFTLIAKTVAPAQVMVVLKANAYGLGMESIAIALEQEGAHRIGVAEYKEASQLKKIVKTPIQILGAIFPWEISLAVEEDIICPVDSYQSARLLSNEALRQKKTCTVHFLVDTGMGRLGIALRQAVSEITECLKLPGLNFEGIYSHFPVANDPGHPKTKEQMEVFNELLSELPKSFSLVHLANSDGINNFPESHFNMVRTGINLYGVFDLLGGRRYALEPTLTLRSQLIAKRKLPAGHPIGYGCTHILEKETWVGTVPAGYADGVPYHLKNQAHVLIQGKIIPVIGNISMDYLTLNLNDLPDVEVGEVVILFGRSGSNEITVEDWARLKETHPYDIICALGHRVTRAYLSM